MRGTSQVGGHQPLCWAVAKIFLSLLGACLLAGLFLVTATWNRAQVFVPQATGAGMLVVFADGDCQSRMQRAAMVAAHPGRILRAHDFENYPVGVVPHTTAPMDYLIAALGLWVRPLDVAGAWVSPLIGLTALIFLFFWAREVGVRPCGPLLMMFCVSPALTHAFALGRPDHQSLLTALTVVALASSFAFIRTARSGWAWASGVVWGLALWVSWFEPLILLAAQEIARVAILRRRAWPVVWRRALLLAGVMAVAAWALEGFRNPWPSAEVRELFPRWAAMLGELQPADPHAMFSWTGWLLVPAPALLIWEYLRRRDPVALMILFLLVVATALTGWQARWSPWQAVTFCLALPWMLAPLRKGWIIWAVFLVSLWPVAWAWDARINPTPAEEARRQEVMAEAALLEQAAQFLQEQPRGGVLAPWWISPALARLSGQPFVGGTSHQSLPGSADAARFFLSEDDVWAADILRARAVKYVVTDAPERIIPTSAQLLGIPAPKHPLITRLVQGRNVPVFLRRVFANPFFCVYKFSDGEL